MKKTIKSNDNPFITNALSFFSNFYLKNVGLLFLVLATFSIISCDKNDEPIVEEPEPCVENVLVISTPDEQSIFDARSKNNEALANHDAPAVASIYRDNFFILTSTNGLFTGKEEVGNIYQSVFDSRENVLFVRTPSKIQVNTDWNMASENGQWVGTWIVDNENIEVGGDYYAKWHKVDGSWQLRCEVYTQFDCQGDVVCNVQPPL